MSFCLPYMMFIVRAPSTLDSLGSIAACYLTSTAMARPCVRIWPRRRWVKAAPADPHRRMGSQRMIHRCRAGSADMTPPAGLVEAGDENIWFYNDSCRTTSIASSPDSYHAYFEGWFMGAYKEESDSAPTSPGKAKIMAVCPGDVGWRWRGRRRRSKRGCHETRPDCRHVWLWSRRKGEKE